MKFVLEFTCDGAAFYDEEGDLRNIEVACIVDSVAQRLFAGQLEGSVMDSNGNRVGHYEVVEDE